jgi:hypothetical protein
MLAEAVLTRANFTVKLIPIPRDLSSECGIAPRFDLCVKDKVIEMLQSKHVEIAGAHSLQIKK